MFQTYIRGYNLSVKERKFYLPVIPEVFQWVISLRANTTSRYSHRKEVQEVATSSSDGFLRGIIAM